jgi:succinyl-CoA synthetase beta subunit
MLNEADALAAVKRFDIPVVAHRLCGTEDEVAQAFDEIGGPIVVKGCSRDIVHKSELGLVRLGIRNTRDARSAFRAVRDSMEKNGLVNDGVIVARMTSGRRELMLGGRFDPVFGPVVILGDGGKYVESMPDARVLIWPFDEDDVRRAVSRLRIAPLFAGVRNEDPLDLESVARAAIAVGRLLADPTAGVGSLDINPLLVGARGEGCLALDAVMYVEKPTS